MPSGVHDDENHDDDDEDAKTMMMMMMTVVPRFFVARAFFPASFDLLSNSPRVMMPVSSRESWPCVQFSCNV